MERIEEKRKAEKSYLPQGNSRKERGKESRSGWRLSFKDAEYIPLPCAGG